MNPLNGLPRTAVIRHPVVDSRLEIKNHKVAHPDSFLRWLLGEDDDADYNWYDVRDQLISQGIRYDAFVETCRTELQDEHKRYRIFYLLSDFYGYGKLLYFTSSVQGRMIADELMGKISTCKTWDQFHDATIWNGDFHSKIKEKIVEGVKACSR